MTILSDGPFGVYDYPEKCSPDASDQDETLTGSHPGTARVRAWCDALASEGYCLDCEPFVWKDIPAFVAETILSSDYESSLTICQSRAQCGQALEAMLAQGLDAAVYPSRVRVESKVDRNEIVEIGNCKNMREVEKAEGMGLPAMGAVCVLCPYNAGCSYLEELDRVRKTAHVVMTASRAIYTDLEGECDKKDVVFVVNGRAMDVLKPIISIDLSIDEVCGSLEVIVEAARECTQARLKYGEYEESLFFRSILELARVLGLGVARGDPGPVSIEANGSPPKGWASAIKDALGRIRAIPDDHLKSLVSICTLHALGKLDKPPLVLPFGDRVTIIARLPTRILSKPVLILDPTLKPRYLEQALDVPVTAVDSSPPPTTALQVAERITAQTRPEVVAKIIRGYLCMGIRQLGVVYPEDCHFEVERHMTPEERTRAIFAGWTGAMTVFHNCDLIIVLGEPPVPPKAVVVRLCHTGQGESAVEEGDWGPLPWVTGTGEDVDRNGYRNPAWREAHQAIQTGRLRQVLANIPGRVILHSAEEMGLPLIQPCIRLNPEQARILETLDVQTRGKFLNSINTNGFSASPESATKIDSSSVPSPLKPYLLYLVALFSDARKEYTTKDLSAISGRSEATVRSHLKILEEVGWVSRKGKRGPVRRKT